MAEKMKFTDRLFQPVDSFSLDIFRALFGIAMILQVASFAKYDFINLGILSPRYHFTYDFLGFIQPFSAPAMKLIMFLMLTGAILIAVNKFFRIGISIFLISFSYFFFLDKSYYNNHFYFIILLSAIFLFYKPLFTGKEKINVVPQWCVWLFQFQVIVVYFYGGLAKLNTDWLFHCQPAKTLLNLNAQNSSFGGLLKSDFAANYITYGGVIFDLSIGFLLLYKPTLKTAIILCILFHITNFFIFNIGEGGDIGIFPLLMIFTNVLFIKPNDLRKLLNKFRRVESNSKSKKSKQRIERIISAPRFSSKKSITLPVLLLYILFQLTFPFRHLIFPGNVDWTGEAQRFSWRMKVYVKTGDVIFKAKQSAQDTPVIIDWKQHINYSQYGAMRDHPEMLLQFAQYLKKISAQKGFNNIIVNAEEQISMNGRTQQYLVDPSLDLLKVKRNPMKHSDWILPLKEN